MMHSGQGESELGEAVKFRDEDFATSSEAGLKAIQARLRGEGRSASQTAVEVTPLSNLVIIIGLIVSFGDEEKTANWSMNRLE